MPTPVRLIVNPSAGGGRAGRIAPSVERALRGHGLQVLRADTRDLEHACELAVEAAGAGDTVAALSGDGMIGAIAGALRSVPNAVLGVLPGGRGNDLARVLGIPDDVERACEVVAHGVPRAIDLGLVTAAGSNDGARAYVGIASAGFDSVANRVANDAPAWLGGQVYAYGALRALISWRPASFELVLEPSGERHSFTGYSVAVANSKAYGGGMMMAPDALLDDGLLEVIGVEHVGKARFLANLPKVFAGTHVLLDSVHAMRAPAVTVSADRPFTMYADGDPIGELPVRVQALRAAVTVLVPAQAANPPFSTPPAERAAAPPASQ